MKKITTIAIAGSMAAGLALFAYAPLALAAVTTDKSDYAPGDTVMISGDGYWGGEQVDITVNAPYGTVSGSAAADAGGAFSWSFVLPSDNSAAGSYTYSATGADSGIVQSGAFTDSTVSAAPVATYSDAGHTTATSTFSQNDTVYASTTVTLLGSGPNPDLLIQWLNASSTKVKETLFSGVANHSQHSDSVSATTTGTWTVRTCKNTVCTGANLVASQTFTVSAAAPPAATLTVIKHVVNDNGGGAVASDWTLTVSSSNGGSGTGSAAGSEAGTAYTLEAGKQYSVAESGPGGYSESDSADCIIASATSGASYTCTITNDDIAPQLTIIKHVVDDNGGAAVASDWTMDVTASNPSQNHFAGAESPGTTITLDAGSYSVDESGGPSGYAEALSADCSGTIAVGESKTCTITNDDIAPSLTLVKVVAGGGIYTPAAWTLTATGPTSFSGPGPSVASDASFSAGTYDLSENGPPLGYTASPWVCAGGGTQLDDHTLQIGLGETVVCTIINTKIGGIFIGTLNRGSITNTTTANTDTGGNSAGGSHGGSGGAGGAVDPKGSEYNNGGAQGGQGGDGGAGGRGGVIQTGESHATSAAANRLNATDVRVGR